MSAGTVSKLQKDNADTLGILRKEIDITDEQILKALAKRVSIVKQIGEYKRKNNVAILQVNRWEEVLSNRINLGVAIGLNLNFVKELYTLIHKESIEVQKR